MLLCQKGLRKNRPQRLVDALAGVEDIACTGQLMGRKFAKVCCAVMLAGVTGRLQSPGGPVNLFHQGTPFVPV